MKNSFVMLFLFIIYGCNQDCENCNPKTGPMISRIQSLRWVSTETPTKRITPQVSGNYEDMLRLNVHMYVVRNDSIIERRRLSGTGNEDWRNHRVILNYENGKKQILQFVYEGNDNRNKLNEVILSNIFTEPYNDKTDTVKIHYVPNGAADVKYVKDEEHILNGK